MRNISHIITAIALAAMRIFDVLQQCKYSRRRKNGMLALQYDIYTKAVSGEIIC
jgi:hypothetical protein